MVITLKCRNVIARIQGMLVANGLRCEDVRVEPAEDLVIITTSGLAMMIENARADAVRVALAGIPRH